MSAGWAQPEGGCADRVLCVSRDSGVVVTGQDNQCSTGDELFMSDAEAVACLGRVCPACQYACDAAFGTA